MVALLGVLVADLADGAGVREDGPEARPQRAPERTDAPRSRGALIQ
jgi:hypothetical protein